MREPRYFDVEREEHLFWRGSVEYLRARGKMHVVAFPLVAGQTILGVMGMAFGSKNDIIERQTELVGGLANQAALAVQLTRLAEEARQTAVAKEREMAAQERAAELAKVNDALKIANEEILEREREKSVLLSISEDISTIRSKDDLFRVVVAVIQVAQQLELELVGVTLDRLEPCVLLARGGGVDPFAQVLHHREHLLGGTVE